jgi:hypothetical protein
MSRTEAIIADKQNALHPAKAHTLTFSASVFQRVVHIAASIVKSHMLQSLSSFKDSSRRSLLAVDFSCMIFS